MKGSLSIGLDFAKGLSVAWGKPLIGVHHMLGHLLTPRFESNGLSPEFPFLTLLISGGHTMLVLSHSLLQHEVLCDTLDVACGDALDKCSRELGLRGNNLGRELEHYVQSSRDNWETHQWGVPKPLYNKRGRVDQIAFAFGSFHGYIKKLKESASLDEDMRQSLAYQVQKGIFDHVITKINLTVEKHHDKLRGVKHFVGSGGVASNMFLRSMLDAYFNEKGFKTSYPSLELCTDNAVMIGWAGIELYEHGLTTELDVCPISKWPLGEIMEAGWKNST
jgi:N6-L-threonylcarbamoyladenine synthase